MLGAGGRRKRRVPAPGARGRKRARRDALRPVLDPAALERPRFGQGRDFLGLGHDAIERVLRYTAILRGRPMVPDGDGPAGPRRPAEGDGEPSVMAGRG